MLGLKDLDTILDKMDKKGKFNDFIYYVFNYKIENKIKQYYIQHIEGDVILYIYEKKSTHTLYTLEFTNGNCDVYMDKSFYKNTFINTIYINKCLEMFCIVDDSVIGYCNAMYASDIETQKEILLKYIPKDIVNIMYED